MTSPSCHCEAQRAEAIPRLNPKLKALNPKQILISKLKVQNRFDHWDFGHLILFSISDLGFRIWFFRDCHASPFAALGASAHRNDNKKGRFLLGKR
jgi:hypothetical protein